MGADESMVELEEKIKHLDKYYHKVFQEYKKKMDKRGKYAKVNIKTL